MDQFTLHNLKQKLISGSSLFIFAAVPQQYSPTPVGPHGIGTIFNGYAITAIGPNMAVTARHISPNADADNNGNQIPDIVDYQNGFVLDGVWRTITGVKIPPAPLLDHDLLFIQFTPATNVYYPIATQWSEGDHVFIVGMGNSEYQPAEARNQERWARSRMILSSTANTQAFFNFDAPNSGQYVVNEGQAGLGDSGGPIFLTSATGEKYLVGVFSRSQNIPFVGYASSMAQTFLNDLPWIQSNVGIVTVNSINRNFRPADFNFDGSVTQQDIFDFLTAWFAQDRTADLDGQSGLSPNDVMAFLNRYFSP